MSVFLRILSDFFLLGFLSSRIGVDWRFIPVLCGIIFTASCTIPAVHDTESADASSPTRQMNKQPLENTAWQLVQITSMDDRVFVPNERDHYMLTFGSEGRLVVRSDCNRGQGSWTHKESSGLEFGPLATTKALCPPGSLDERFIRELRYVRSYGFEDEHLFLATMADGSILEFEPVPL